MYTLTCSLAGDTGITRETCTLIGITADEITCTTIQTRVAATHTNCNRQNEVQIPDIIVTQTKISEGVFDFQSKNSLHFFTGLLDATHGDMCKLFLYHSV